MLAHILSDEESIQHLVDLTHTGQFEECLQQGILLLPQLHDETQQARVLCALIESAFQLAKFQEAAYYFPLFEKMVNTVEDPVFPIYHLLFKGHFHMRIHGDAQTALACYQEGLASAFEKKEYNSLAAFIKYIIRHRVDEVDVDKLLALAELACIFSHWPEPPKEGVRISAAMALLECYCLTGNGEQFEKLVGQLSSLPSLPRFPNELARLQVLRANLLRGRGYYAQALCLMDQASMHYEKRQEYVLLLEQLLVQREFVLKVLPERADALEKKIERTRKLAMQASSHFHHSVRRGGAYCEETAVFHFHQSIEKRLANGEKFLYLLAFAEDAACHQELREYPCPHLELSGNRFLYVMEDREIPADFPACNLPRIPLAIVYPQEGKTAMQLFHEAHAQMYYLYDGQK
ncbi:MAG: hypothetical protein ACI33P_10625 [Lysinibacillus sp.]